MDHTRAEAVVSCLESELSWLGHQSTPLSMGLKGKDLPSSEKCEQLTCKVVIGEITRLHNACNDVFAVLS
jgi:hypothetical protein